MVKFKLRDITIRWLDHDNVCNHFESKMWNIYVDVALFFKQ